MAPCTLPPPTAWAMLPKSESDATTLIWSRWAGPAIAPEPTPRKTARLKLTAFIVFIIICRYSYDIRHSANLPLELMRRMRSEQDLELEPNAVCVSRVGESMDQELGTVIVILKSDLAEFAGVVGHIDRRPASLVP